jgi:hypothetical protein
VVFGCRWPVPDNGTFYGELCKLPCDRVSSLYSRGSKIWEDDILWVVCFIADLRQSTCLIHAWLLLRSPVHVCILVGHEHFPSTQRITISAIPQAATLRYVFRGDVRVVCIGEVSNCCAPVWAMPDSVLEQDVRLCPIMPFKKTVFPHAQCG